MCQSNVHLCAGTPARSLRHACEDYTFRFTARACVGVRTGACGKDGDRPTGLNPRATLDTGGRASCPHQFDCQACGWPPASIRHAEHDMVAQALGSAVTSAVAKRCTTALATPL